MIGDYEMDDGSWDCEREQADYDQAALEEAGNRHARVVRKVKALLEVAKGLTADPLAASNIRQQAATLCLHGGGYGLKGSAAVDAGDPRAGEEGYRCHDCGSVVDDIMGDVLIPCEIVVQ